MTRASQFSTDVRRPLDDGDARKSSTGPGSYNPGKCADHVSMYVKHHGQRFSSAARARYCTHDPLMYPLMYPLLHPILYPLPCSVPQYSFPLQ